MNSKIKSFLISQSIVFIFTLVLVLFLHYICVSMFGFNQDNSLFILVPLIIFGLFLFLLLSKPILEPLFKSDENLQKTLKETLHELNIPVSTIILNSQMLQRRLEDEKALKRVDRIQKASQDLLELYEQMEYSIKKEIDKIDNSEVFLGEVINDSIDKFYDIKKDTKIEVDIPEIKILTDINGFKKTFENLLSNAIKYNCKDNPLVKVGYKDNILSVYNSGERIDTKNLIMIFDRYYQSNSSNDGFGLGLNIVKEFCDKNKIAITIDTFDHGNSFNLNLKNLIIA